ncbi:cytochrome c1 [Parapusillimonas granuli]|uniref:Cytochrome c1 n=1 Tax=Parapusillimonas granuli TaxID=380911 RepID=A0A853G9S6_9BURK|nr:cytochrome c1 [Parapusillimonas granuli]MEB2399847.1 cytochrome c1 [Alcaligenaceae bacterium]NYT51496.1 cytochrome c1 [Parapusillimonas granuli]
MIMIKKLLGAIALSLTCGAALAAGGGYKLESAPNRINDMAALQNGAKLFVNYCLGCHSANSMRYNKLAEIGLTDDQIKKNLLFTGDKVGDLMKIAMTPEDAKKWFGAAPPDLSVIARAKSTTMGPSGVDYVYTFLRTFYRDTTKATGWNNLVFPSVGMPNPLWEMEGPRSLNHVTVHQVEKEGGALQWERTTAKYDTQGFADIKSEPLADYRGNPQDKAVLESADPKRVAAFDSNVADLANFLGWMAEPVQQQRKQMGVWILLFLGLFLVVAWRLNAAYWKHVR